MLVSGAYMYHCGEKRGPWNNLSSHANVLIQQHPKGAHVSVFHDGGSVSCCNTMQSSSGLCALYGVFQMLLKNFKVPQNQQSNPSYQSIISNVCRNLYCIRSQAFVSMIKVHSIVLYNHGVNFIADIHTCTCVINLIKYTNWIVLLSMCNLLYG